MLTQLKLRLSNAAQELRFILDRKQAGFIRERRPRFPSDRVPVFTYRAAEDPFEQEMTFLAREGYRTLSADELVTFLDGRPLDGPAVAITFDGGHASLSTRALPVLKGLGLKATAFIVPAWVGQPGRLSWRQIEHLAHTGHMDVQSNTMNHRILAGRDASDVEHELRDAKRAIEEHVPGHIVRHVAFPGGLGSEHAVALAHRTGHIATFWGRRPGRLMNGPGDDPFRIVRIPHEYLRRLPGSERIPLAALVAGRFVRSLRGHAVA